MVFENRARDTTTLLSVLVVCAVMFSPDLLRTELSSPLFVLLGLSIFILAAGRVKRSYLNMVWPLLAITIIGITGVADHQQRDVLRDISFSLTPISLIFIGYWLADNGGRWQQFMKVMVTCGAVLAVVHISKFIQNPALLTMDIDKLRSAEGAGSTGSLVVLSLVLALFQYRLGIGNLFPKFFPRVIALPVLLASFVLSYSRTEFMVMLMLSLALWGLLTKLNSRMILTVAVLLISFFAISLTTPINEVGTFRSKLTRSFTEVTVSNYGDEKSINDNWRGFETYRALETFSSGNVMHKIFGQGFGALTDLGFYMPLGEQHFRYIPVLHNGYAYILIKAGIIGVFLYFIFYLKIIKSVWSFCNSKSIEQRFLARLLLGCVLGLILVMFVVGGMAQTAEPALVLLLGYLTRCIGKLQSKTGYITTWMNRS